MKARHRTKRADLPRPSTVRTADIARDLRALPPLTDEDRAALAARPRTRGECVNGPRPCPWVGCRHHMLLDVNPRNGSIKFNHPGLEFDEIGDTCSLDVAEIGSVLELERVGERMNLTKERVRQIELRALLDLSTDEGLR